MNLDAFISRITSAESVLESLTAIGMLVRFTRKGQTWWKQAGGR